MKSLPLGAHMSVEGGLFRALERGKSIGCRTIQLFTRNSNRWAAKDLTLLEIEKFKSSRLQTGITPVFAHCSYLINLAAQRLKYELHQTFQAKGYDVTPEQWAVLNRLWEEDGLSQVELAERTFKDKPSTTRILNLLEKKKIVVRRRDAEDRRVMHVFLTKAGRDLKGKLIPCAEEVLAKGGQDLTRKEVLQMKQTLTKILDNLE